jgi:hypothetical protein
MMSGTFRSLTVLGAATALVLVTAVPSFAVAQHHRAHAAAPHRSIYNYAPNGWSMTPGGADAVQPMGPPDPASCGGFRC